MSIVTTLEGDCAEFCPRTIMPGKVQIQECISLPVLVGIAVAVAVALTIKHLKLRGMVVVAIVPLPIPIKPRAASDVRGGLTDRVLHATGMSVSVRYRFEIIGKDCFLRMVEYVR